MLLILELGCVSPLGEEVLFFVFVSPSERDCSEYLTVCPSHLTLTSAAVNTEPRQALSSSRVPSRFPSAYQCCLPRAQCRQVVLYRTEGQRLGNEISLLL